MKNGFRLNLRQLTVVLFSIMGTAPLVGQMEVGVHSGIEVPVSRGTYPIESGLSLSGEFTLALPVINRLSALGDFSYSRHEFTGLGIIQFVSGQAGLLYRIPVMKNFSLSPGLAGGYFYNWSDNLADSGGNILLSAGIRGDYRIVGAFQARLQGNYKIYTGSPEPLFTAFVVSLGIQYRPDQAGRPANLEISPPEAPVLFPIYRYHYDSHPFGHASLTNRENEPLSDLSVTFYVPEYMREPKVCAFMETLMPGETVRAGLLALLSDEILNVTEGKKTEGTISVDYRFRDKTFTTSRTETMEIIHRNGITWEDDRSAACFITARDPDIMAVGKRLAGFTTKIQAGEVPSSILKAAGVYAFIYRAGLRYAVDPSTPYAALSEKTGTIDYLQFPIQTLNYYGGDCDDLTILYCSLLESMGISTALITVPGHIYMAIDSGMTPPAFQSLFGDSLSFIETDGRAWIPLEVTSIGESFLRAWSLGWDQWEAAGENRSLYPVSEAWEVYPPVQPVFREDKNFTYSPADTEEALRLEAARFTGSILARLSQPLEDLIEKEGRDYRSLTRLGILHARFGEYDRAEPLFREALRQRQSPALRVNLANIAFIKGDYDTAVREYGVSLSTGRSDPFIVRQLSESYLRLGNYKEAEKYTAMLEQAGGNNASPPAGRAAGVSAGEVNLQWMVE